MPLLYIGLVVEAVGMWESRERFPRAVGRVENLGLVFHSFHGPSFPRLSGLMWFGSFLLLLRCAAEAIRFRTGLKNMSAIGDSIQQCFA